MAEINLKKNILISSSFRVLIMIVSFLTGWISTRFLGVELKGKYGYLLTIISFTWIVLDLGLHKTYPYLIRKEADRYRQLFFWSIIQFCLELSIFLCLGLSFISVLSHLLKFQFQPLTIILVSLAITLTKLSQHMQMNYLGQDKVSKCSFYQFLNSLIMFLLVGMGWVLFHSPDRLHYVLAAYDTALFITVLCFTLPLIVSPFWKGFDLRFIIKSYSLGWRVFLSGLFITLLIRFDVIIIRHYKGFADLGIYSVAANIVDMLQLAANLVGSLLLVKLSDISDTKKQWELLQKIFFFFFILLGCANLGFVIVGKPLLTFMYGRDFTNVYYVYLWLIPASFGLSFGSLFNTYLWSKGFPWMSVLLPLLALILNIGLNFALIPIMGIYGAALATSISYVGWFILILIYESLHSKTRVITYLLPRADNFRGLYSIMRSTFSTARTYFHR